jgi:hypothetical protein
MLHSDELPHKPAMRITGLAKGSKAKTIRVWHPTLLIVRAFEEVRRIEGFDLCAKVDRPFQEEIDKGEPDIVLRWLVSGQRSAKRVTKLQGEVAACEARTPESFIEEIEAHNTSQKEYQLYQMRRWDMDKEFLDLLVAAKTKLSQANLWDKHSMKILKSLEEEILEEEISLQNTPRIREVTLLPSGAEDLLRWKHQTLTALKSQLQSQQELLEKLTIEGKRAQRQIRKFLRQIVAAEMAPLPSEQVAA